MRTRRAIAIVLTGLVMALVTATPATAHTGKLKLAVAGDGATGITIQATYADGHRLDRVVNLVVNATAEGGRKIGPLQLAPAPEGQGFYATGPVLSPGRWRVTVSAPAPNATTTTAQVDARAAQTPPPPVRAEPTGAARPGSAAADDDGTTWWWRAAIGVLVLVALAVATPLLLRTRRSRRA